MTDEEVELPENFFKEYSSVCLSIDKMTKKVHIPHI